MTLDSCTCVRGVGAAIWSTAAPTQGCPGTVSQHRVREEQVGGSGGNPGNVGPSGVEIDSVFGSGKDSMVSTPGRLATLPTADE